VVGFRTPAGGGPVSAADGQAWPEVLFSGVGWVAFDPMPKGDTPPVPLEDEFLPKPEPPTTPPDSVETPEDATWTPPPPSSSTEVAAGPGPDVAVIAGTAGGSLVTLFVLGVLTIVLLRAVRRRGRLERGPAGRRVLGAWDEVLDALLLAGDPPAPHLAAAEVAAHAAAVADAVPAKKPRPAAPSLQPLASKVNAVGFAGGTVPAADDLAAATAKIQALEYVRALRSRRTWWRRLLWRIDPRPLRRTPR
jgi:hypothetical protein